MILPSPLEGEARASEAFNLTQRFEDIEDSEYEIRWQSSVEALQSPNRANNLRFTYQASGFEVTARAPKVESDLWSAGIYLTGVGQLAGFEAAPNATFLVDKKQAAVRHGPVTIEYLNDKEGMRQNFILDAKPTPVPGLMLALSVQLAGLQMGLDEVKGEVWFFNVQTGEPEFSYSDLNVWDSTGRVLPSRFHGLGDVGILITVDDTNAIYPVTVDPLSSTPHRNYSENQSGGKYGYSLGHRRETCGESHLIVVAPFYDNGQTDEGRVFVYYESCGPNGFSTSASWTAESNQAYAEFGHSVTALDSSGDTAMDFAIGAPKYDYVYDPESGGTYYDAGAVFIFHGSTSGLGSSGTPSNADWVVYGSAYSQYGYSVAGIKGLNSAAAHSLAVGAPYYDDGVNYYAGRVYAYYGQSGGIPTTASWTSTGAASELHGISVAEAGDVDDDNDTDLIVGAPNGTYGYARIYHSAGGALVSSPSATLSDSQSGSKFGWSVSSAGDVNGDGAADVIVGAPLFDNGQTDEGRASVFHGSTSGVDTTADWTVDSDQAGAQAGFSVSSVAEYNSDSYGSIIVGAPYWDVTTNGNEGRAAVFDGSSSGLGLSPSWGQSNVNANANFGYAVWSFDGQYFRGIIVGAPGVNNVVLFTP